jgi:hypothetical protein
MERSSETGQPEGMARWICPLDLRDSARVPAAAGDPAFYSTAAQIVPALALAAMIEAHVLWRFAQPLLHQLDAGDRGAVERAASLAALVFIIVIILGEAQALYRLTHSRFIFTGDWPIYLSIWTAGLGIVLPYVLAQIRWAARALVAAGRPRPHLLIGGGVLAAYLVAAVIDVATRI